MNASKRHEQTNCFTFASINISLSLRCVFLPLKYVLFSRQWSHLNQEKNKVFRGRSDPHVSPYQRYACMRFLFQQASSAFATTATSLTRIWQKYFPFLIINMFHFLTDSCVSLFKGFLCICDNGYILNQDTGECKLDFLCFAFYLKL